MKHEPLPNRLRVLRAERRMTQFDVMKETGIQVTRYYFLERGIKNPKPDEVSKLADAFGVRPRALGFRDIEQVSA